MDKQSESTEPMSTTRFHQLPHYQCHKVVAAAKIKGVVLDRDLAKEEGRETTGGAFLRCISPVTGTVVWDVDVDQEFLTKHNPKAGGYFVVYQDGYESFSPAEAFEDGYRLLEENTVLPEGELTAKKGKAYHGQEPVLPKGGVHSFVNQNQEYQKELLELSQKEHREELRKYCLEQAVKISIHGTDNGAVTNIATKYYEFLTGNLNSPKKPST